MKLLKTLVSLLAAFSVLTVCAAASDGYEAIAIYYDGFKTEWQGLLVGKTTYVPFEDVNDILSDGSADISGTASKMTSKSPLVTVNAAAYSLYIEAEGRYLAGNCLILNGKLYVPVRTIAAAYDADVYWNDPTRSVELYSGSGAITDGDSYYSSDEVYWLSRIISAEAKGEPFEGKVMVGNVILNRVASESFPDTIYDVIFDRKFGVQFTPIINGSIYDTPTAESVIAAKLCLEGYSLSEDAMYFLNPKWATNFWVPNNRPYITTVGSHDFYG